MHEDTIPLYEVEELSLEEAILALASDQEKQQTIYTRASERLLGLVA
ncbi:hypothetical protein [Thiohalophilus sp.]